MMNTLRPITSILSRPSTYSTNATNRTAHLTPTSLRLTNHPRQNRTFLTNPFSGPQTLTANRTLHHPPRAIYNVISDVSSYSNFVPYCQSSVVTKHSSPASDGKTYAEEAKLVVGFDNGVSEEFWSRVYCVPESVVEAVSGSADTTLGAVKIRHHNARPEVDRDPTRKDVVMSHLLTRWTLRPSTLGNGEGTEVDLAIEYEFANPVYAALSQAAAPKVADKMIEAFEKRVEAVAQARKQSR